MTVYYLPTTDANVKRLGREIIYQAMLDLINEEETEEALRDSQDACRWFFMHSNDFAFVCDMAGWTPRAVRKRARQVQNNPQLLGGHHD